MDFNQFLIETLGQDTPGVRRGQALMNRLHEVHSGLYHAVPWDLDPYHDDKLIPVFLQWLGDRWDRYQSFQSN